MCESYCASIFLEPTKSCQNVEDSWKQTSGYEHPHIVSNKCYIKNDFLGLTSLGLVSLCPGNLVWQNFMPEPKNQDI